MRIALAFAILAFSFAAAAVAATLGDAPRRFEPQDASAWKSPLVPRAAIGRDSVAALYRSQYLPGNNVALAWTGSIPGCNPGTTNADHQQAVITRVNYYRALVGLPAVTLLGADETSQVQAAALMMSANTALSHMPPGDWTCYSAAGATGAGSANIALGQRGVGAIDLYIDDPGPNNDVAGHRRWILFPPRAAMATGDVAGGNTPPLPANALYVFGPSTTRPATPDGVAWPPAGFVPYQNLPLRSNRWSLSFPGADFSGASVSMSGPAGAIPVTREPPATGFGDNTIVFLPSGVSYGKPPADTAYQIVVSGIAGVNVPQEIRYSVTVIDPDATPSAPAANYTGLWWNFPAESESGWGINFAHQGDVIFATWFTYDPNGKAWWLSMTASATSANTFSGTLYRTQGPAFNAMPFDPNSVISTPVGNATIGFSDASNGVFAYTVNGISQRKAITRQVFGPLPACTFGTEPNLANATNYQDLWWGAPAGFESGWGINFAHEGDTIFATWFTYEAGGAPLWLSFTAHRSAPGVYTGTLYRTTGSPFSAMPFDPNATVATPVGTATLSFANGNAGSFSYLYNGVSQTKAITRQVFRTPGTTCR